MTSESVIVAHEKHGTTTHATALGLLAERVADGYWYDFPEGSQQRAEAIVAEGDEARAWRFLCERRDHEYESVERQAVR